MYRKLSMSENTIEKAPEEAVENGDEDCTKIQQTGEVIKPEVTEEAVRALAERLYGISCLEIKELNSYDDRNYKITEDRNMKNPIIFNHCPDGYVLKIMNSVDSQKLPCIEAQNEAMIYLCKHKIGCPKPVRNVYGHYFSLEKISGRSHVVRLLEYQPGEILASVPMSDFLFYQVGEYIAKLDRLLKKKFYHTGYDNHKSLWMLEAFPEIEKFKSAVTDPEMLRMVNEVLKEFNETIVPLFKKLERGLLHGDFNEQNIIVNKNKDSAFENDYRITGVLDFGDMQVSCYLFELAITMAYAMILGKDLRTGGIVLAGYSTIRIVPPEELHLLRVAIAARFCQSYVLGVYTHAQNPDNTYVLSSKKAIEELLPLVWNETNESASELWKGVSDDYLTKSTR